MPLVRPMLSRPPRGSARRSDAGSSSRLPTPLPRFRERQPPPDLRVSHGPDMTPKPTQEVSLLLAGLASCVPLQLGLVIGFVVGILRLGLVIGYISGQLIWGSSRRRGSKHWGRGAREVSCNIEPEALTNSRLNRHQCYWRPLTRRIRTLKFGSGASSAPGDTGVQ